MVRLAEAVYAGGTVGTEDDIDLPVHAFEELGHVFLMAVSRFYPYVVEHFGHCGFGSVGQERPNWFFPVLAV